MPLSLLLPAFLSLAPTPTARPAQATPALPGHWRLREVLDNDGRYLALASPVPVLHLVAARTFTRGGTFTITNGKTVVQSGAWRRSEAPENVLELDRTRPTPADTYWFIRTLSATRLVLVSSTGQVLTYARP